MSKLLRLPAQLYSVRQFKPDRIGISIDLSHGCFHRCRYCPHHARTPKTVTFARREVLAKAIRVRGFHDRTLYLSGQSDPYPPHQDTCDFARTVLETLLNHSSARPAVVVATKGGTRAVRDFDLLPKFTRSLFWTSCVFTDQKAADFWEPHAAPIGSRLEALQEAKRRGIQTAVSFCPVIDQAQALAVAERVSSLIDVYCWAKPNDWTSPGRVGGGVARAACGIHYHQARANYLRSLPPPVMPWSEFARKLGSILEGIPDRTLDGITLD